MSLVVDFLLHGCRNIQCITWCTIVTQKVEIIVFLRNNGKKYELLKLNLQKKRGDSSNENHDPYL